MAQFTTQVASDVIRDGLGVELVSPSGAVVAEVFRCDADKSVVVRTFEDVPLQAIQHLIQRAELALDPFEDSTPLGNTATDPKPIASIGAVRRGEDRGAQQQPSELVDVTATVLNFRSFLSAGYSCWATAVDLAADIDSEIDAASAFYDWAQTSWELLVERVVCITGQSLVVYGPGSDYEEGRHCRVFFHHLLPTHEVACFALRGEAPDVLTGNVVEDLSTCSFEGFATQSGAWYRETPPFDHALLERDGHTFLVSNALIRFGLRPLSSGT